MCKVIVIFICGGVVPVIHQKLRALQIFYVDVVHVLLTKHVQLLVPPIECVVVVPEYVACCQSSSSFVEDCSKFTRKCLFGIYQSICVQVYDFKLGEVFLLLLTSEASSEKNLLLRLDVETELILHLLPKVIVIHTIKIRIRDLEFH